MLMQTTRPLLRLGCPARFRDRWQGRLTDFEIDEDWLVLNVVVSRGLFRPVEVRLPFSIAAAWDDGALSLDCTSDQAFGRELPPVAAPAMPISARTPVSAAGVRLAGALVERESRRVSRLLLTAGLLGRRTRAVDVRDVPRERGAVQLTAQLDALPVYQPDAELLQAVRDALAAHPYLTADDRRAVSVEVADGVAHLSGNVRTLQAEASVREADASVPGVGEVRSAGVGGRTPGAGGGRGGSRAGARASTRWRSRGRPRLRRAGRSRPRRARRRANRQRPAGAVRGPAPLPDFAYCSRWPSFRRPARDGGAYRLHPGRQSRARVFMDTKRMLLFFLDVPAQD